MKDPLRFNKYAAAGLTALLLIFGLPQLTNALFGGGHGGGHGGEMKLAYPVEIEFGAPAAGEEAPEVTLAELLAEANPAAGERRAALCKSCHTFERGGANLQGPNLWDVVGRPVASVEGFSYTPAMKALGGEWTYERLDKLIENSQAFLPGTAMVQRFPRADQRADILAYLATLSDDPVPFPEPPARAAEAAPEEAAAGEAAPGDAATTEESGEVAPEGQAPEGAAGDGEAAPGETAPAAESGEAAPAVDEPAARDGADQPTQD
ncbi:c-type cytochrome [Amphiplicatus metriothermophilus]|uniref:Cytochrome c n=1 Tax=Amphiplicatus metriothermophilus TaxID=1519374 RepID=A0A239PK68_9PROT|nr:cytochrome c family protein [Amphiplicatus metriothermophilus]MBB5517454.1 cytochrome c [Amphiplicatus metriothermophilus]SNT68211.1 cytochrome c [Amphiplicatus metriothermophilus]